MSVVTLKLEAVGDNIADHLQQIRRGAELYRLPQRFRSALYMPSRRPWIAEITEWRGGRWYDRSFLKGQKDFSEANSVGSRGVYVYYHLREGEIYEVHELLTWKASRRYFCTVREGQVVEMSTDEVQAALTERAEREAGLV